MNHFSLGLHISLVITLILIFCSVEVNAQADEKSLILKNCTELFGPPVDAEQSLFEINSLYALAVRFDSQGSLNELAFFPKYFFGETYPEWNRPQAPIHLSKVEYENLLKRLDSVKSKGNLIKTAANPTTSNFSVRFLDQYERAFLYRVEELGDSLDVHNVRFASLYFSHEIEGKVRKKQKYQYSWLRKDYYQVSVGKLNYFVGREVYLKLRPGRVAKFPAVGPIKGICDDSNCNP